MAEDTAVNVPLRYHHKLAVQRRLGSLDLDVKLELSTQWTMLFGPSGSGKSSLLRAACGLLGRKGVLFERAVPDKNWKVLQDDATYTPPEQRNISWAPQHAALLPHLSVRENIAFGASAKDSQAKHQALIDEVITMLQLDALASRMPRDLSGGERQRVNLARAFATPNCELLLLDEPFTGIDHALRDELLPKLRAWARDHCIPVLSVSHDVEEAFQLQVDIVMLREGKVDTWGYVTKVLYNERNRLISNLH